MTSATSRIAAKQMLRWIPKVEINTSANRLKPLINLEQGKSVTNGNNLDDIQYEVPIVKTVTTATDNKSGAVKSTIL